MTTTYNPTPAPISPDIAEGRRLLAEQHRLEEIACGSLDYHDMRVMDLARENTRLWASDNLCSLLTLLTEAETYRARAEAAEARLAEADRTLSGVEGAAKALIISLGVVHLELMRKQGLSDEQAKGLTWPDWSHPANSIRMAEKAFIAAASWRSTGGEGDRAARLAQAIAAIKTAMRAHDLAEARVWMQVALDFASNDEAALAEGAAFVDPAPPPPTPERGSR